MCVDKGKFEELSHAVAEVKRDTASIKKDIKAVRITLREQNSRIGKSEGRHTDTEHRLDNLEDPIRKGAYCVQAETIAEMKSSMLKTDKFEDYLQAEKQDKKDEDLLRANKTRWIVGAVGAGIAVVNILVGILLYILK